MAQKQKNKSLKEHRFLVQAGAFVAIAAGAIRGGFFGESEKVKETVDTDKALAETNEVTCVISDFNNVNTAELTPTLTVGGDDSVATSNDLAYAAELTPVGAGLEATGNDQTKPVKTPDGLTSAKQVSSADHNESNLSYGQAKHIADANGAAVSTDAKDSVIGTPKIKLLMK